MENEDDLLEPDSGSQTPTINDEPSSEGDNTPDQGDLVNSDDLPSQTASSGTAAAQAVLDADKKYENTVESVIQSSSSVDENSLKPEKFVTIDGEDHEHSGFFARIGKSFSGLSFGLKAGILGGGAVLIGAIIVGIVLLFS